MVVVSKPIAARMGGVALTLKSTPLLSNTKVGRKIEDVVVDKTGYDPIDMLSAPFKPPELLNVRPSVSPVQLVLIFGGLIIALLGLLLIFTFITPVVGIILAVLGAVAIVVGTLVRVGG